MFEKYNFQEIASGLIIPALILVIALGAYFVLLPSVQDVRAKQALLGSERSKLAEVAGSFSDIQKLTAELEEKQAKLASIDQAIPASPEIPELLGNFDYLAGQSGITIISLQLRPAETAETARAGGSAERLKRLQEIMSATKDLAAINIELSMAGSYQNLKAFLANLESNLRLLDIEQIIVSGTDSETDLQEYSLIIQTYYQK